MRIDPSDLAEAVEHDRVELCQELAAGISSLGAAEADLLDTLRRCDEAELWRVDGARNAGEWTAAWTGWSQWKSRRVVAAAQALTSLPVIASAHRAGALALDKVVELTRFATPDTEGSLVNWARGVSAARVRERADEECGRSLAETQDAHDSRKLEMWAADERWYLEAQLPLEQGAAVEQVIRAAARTLPKRPQEQDESPVEHKRRSMRQRGADALVGLVTGGSSFAPDSTLTLHAPLEQLGREDGAISFGGGLLHGETVRRLSCDSRIQVVLEDGARNPVGIGRKSRNIPGWLRQAVMRRDGNRCTFPGCESRAELAGHHITHWVRHGPTDLDNLCAVCPLHHYYVHEGRWSVILRGQRTIWFRPDGRVYDPGIPPPEEITVPRPTAPSFAAAAGYSRLFDLIPRKRAAKGPPEPQLLRNARRRRSREHERQMTAVVR